uniref:Uncharacterized protein n=1 Tax=Leptobrachium leishanense TaxID=445787 RepID=A0A8C5PVC9_9ANUR
MIVRRVLTFDCNGRILDELLSTLRLLHAPPVPNGTWFEEKGKYTPRKLLLIPPRDLRALWTHFSSRTTLTPAATSKMEDGPSPSPRMLDHEEVTCHLERLISALPTKADLSDMVADLRDNFGREVLEIRTEVTTLSTRVGALEEVAQRPPPETSATLPAAFSELQRRVDDLDNRGRRHNIRVRGLPESDGPKDPRAILTELFNQILNRKLNTPILFDRAHRALRPRPPPTVPPRDAICHLTEFALKESIMLKARSSRQWDFHQCSLELYQDLSPFTLAARRCLQPVTQALRQDNLPYRWGFPFTLLTLRNGVRHAICYPTDVPAFLEAMELPEISIRIWEDMARLGPELPCPRRHRSRRRARASPDCALARELSPPHSPHHADD